VNVRRGHTGSPEPSTFDVHKKPCEQSPVELGHGRFFGRHAGVSASENTITSSPVTVEMS